MKVKIGVSEYDLKTVNNDGINSLYGDCNESSVVGGLIHPIMNHIYINTDVPMQSRIQSFFHECMHGMLDQIGAGELYEDENFVDALSKQVYGLFKNNNLEKIYAFLGDKKSGKS